METKFNFNSQVCTSVEQSRRLLELGLKKETADCYWKDEAYFDDYEDWNAYVGSPKHSKHIPAWSLHRLWELANIKHIILDSEDEIAVLYDEVIMKIEQFIKEGYFNKEYLENGN